LNHIITYITYHSKVKSSYGYDYTNRVGGMNKLLWI